MNDKSYRKRWTQRWNKAAPERRAVGYARMTYSVAMAAAQDAGNRHMERFGRTSWNETDWNAAADALRPLLEVMDR